LNDYIFLLAFVCSVGRPEPVAGGKRWQSAYPLTLGNRLYMQCGFKAFEREALFDILDDIEDKHWFWDTECLIRAYKKGYKIVEFPVKWKDKESSKVNVVRDSAGMGGKAGRIIVEGANERIKLEGTIISR